MTEVTRERLEAALRDGVEIMGMVLAEYNDAGENDRPFVGRCTEWYKTSSTALADSPTEKPAEYGRSKSMDKRLKAQGMPEPRLTLQQVREAVDTSWDSEKREYNRITITYKLNQMLAEVAPSGESGTSAPARMLTHCSTPMGCAACDLTDDEHVEGKQIPDPRPPIAASGQGEARTADLISADKLVDLIDPETLKAAKFCYRLPGESLQTANLGAWYYNAVYWKHRALRAELTLAATPAPERAAKE